jgi:predicted ATPase
LLLTESQTQTKTSSHRELVLIRGHAGTGKNGLTHTVRKNAEDKCSNGGLFAGGKFDYQSK